MVQTTLAPPARGAFSWAARRLAPRRAARLLGLLVALAVPPVQADFERGVQAYQRGDYATAFAEMQREAKRGHAEAQYNLANMLLLGTGVPTNEQQAAFWFARAAEQGWLPAQYELAKSYALGRGIAADPQLAYVWFSVAAARGDRRSQRNKQVMSERLSELQLDRADALAEDYYHRYAGSD